MILQTARCSKWRRLVNSVKEWANTRHLNPFSWSNDKILKLSVSSFSSASPFKREMNLPSPLRRKTDSALWLLGQHFLVSRSCAARLRKPESADLKKSAPSPPAWLISKNNRYSYFLAHADGLLFYYCIILLYFIFYRKQLY